MSLKKKVATLCPHCGRAVEGHLSTAQTQREGDLSICLVCLSVLETRGGALLVVSEARIAELPLEQRRALNSAKKLATLYYGQREQEAA